MTRGKIFVISAPSGAGKTTLLQRVMERIPRLAFSVSHTTRKPRGGEKDGIDYHFVSQQSFLQMIDNDSFLEYARVHDNYYGTSREALLDQIGQGVDVILDIDVQGAAILRRDATIDAAHIFVAPPSMAELERRLRSRGTDAEEVISKRLKNARDELQAASSYEYLLVNDDLQTASEVLVAIVIAERARAHRSPTGERLEDFLNR